MTTFTHKLSRRPLFIASLLSLNFFLGACSSSDKDKIEESVQDAEDNLIEEYKDADGIHGGQLYSKFWSDGNGETNFSVDNSALESPDELGMIDDYADFFRCKQCHGWDRLGQEGAYSSRAPNANRPRVASINLAQISEDSSAQELYDKIAKTGSSRRGLSVDLSAYDPEDESSEGNKMPDFTQILTEEQIWDLVKYLKKEALDTTELYTLVDNGGNYPDGDPQYDDVGKNGDTANGDDLYADNCASCHGSDGASGSVGLIEGEYSVGWYARAKPYETQHKIKFGHLGSTMTASLVLNDADESDARDLLAALANSEKYPNEAQPALDGEALYSANCLGCHPVGTRTGASATQITNAISSLSAMSHLSSLSSDEIQVIADYL